MNRNIAKRFCFLTCLMFSGMAAVWGGNPDSTPPKSGVCSNHCCCSENYTPIGVMTDHLHPKGKLAFSYAFMQMRMAGNLSGTQSVSQEAILTNYVMTPTTMTMQMHMLMAMYGLNDRLTLMGMANYNRNDMTMAMAPMDRMMNMPGMNMSAMLNMPSNCRTSGLGDTRLYAIYRLLKSGRQRLIVAGGLNVPTGSTTMNGATLLGNNTRLPYMMQLGSGTWDLLPALTYTSRNGHLFWGANLEGSIPVGVNARGYAWGPQVKSSAWLSYQCLSWAAASFRMEATASGRMNGYDPQVALLMANDPSADAAHTGGQRAQMYLGLQFSQLGSLLSGATIQVEFGLPVYQKLNGPQMRTQNTVQAGCMYAF